MSDLANSNWSETAASNNAAPPNGWPEGMAPSAVNNAARENMAAIKRFWDQINAIKTTAGTTTAYTLTYDVAAAALYDGEFVSFVVNATCGAAPTLNKNSLGAKNLRKFTAGAYTNLAASDLVANQIVLARYNLSADKWDVVLSSFNVTDFVRSVSTITMGAAINEAKGADIASAATTDIGAATGNFVHVTGTTTITALGTIQAGTRRVVVFTGILILTHNATSLILPTGASITTAAGDCAEFESEGSGNWRCTDYQRANGKALAETAYTPPQTAQAYVTIAAGVATVEKQEGFTSVARTANGKYECTLSVAMPDLNYVILFTAGSDPGVGSNGPIAFEVSNTARTTTVFHLGTLGDNASYQDCDRLSIKVFA